MNRRNLLEPLVLASAALAADSDTIAPAFASFCFDGKNVVAHDDIVAISLPLKTKLKGFVSGALLLRFLKACVGKEVEFIQKKAGTLTVKCGAARLRLSVSDPHDYPFKFPTLYGKLMNNLNGEFFTGLELCSKIVSDRGISSWLGGVLFDFGKQLTLYSVSGTRDAICVYDNKGMGVKSKEDHNQIILPVSFCKVVLSMYKKFGAKNSRIAVRENYAVIYFDDKGAVFGKAFVASKKPNIAGKVRGHLEGVKSFIPILSTFRNALLRSSAVAGNNGLCTLTVNGGKLKMETRTPGSMLNDLVSLKAKHKEIEVKIDPHLLIKMLEHCKEFVIQDNCVVMRSGSGLTYITANKTS